MPAKQRFEFIDWFRGLIIVCMALDHASYYFNSAWLSLDSLDPFFDSWGQALLRYIPYLCAPGFLMMNGAMVWWAFVRRQQKGVSHWRARWELWQRGLFLIAFQLLWVNSSWGGFTRLRLDHFGIIACIGGSMLLLTCIISWPAWSRLLLAGIVFVTHPLLLKIPYDLDGPSHVLWQMFVFSGEFNKYPIMPWFGVALVGSVMAGYWFEKWRAPGEIAHKSMLIGLGLLAAAVALRMTRGFGNIFSYGEVGTWSFFYDQKYPSSLFYQLWWSGMCILLVGAFSWLGNRTRILEHIGLGTVGKVSLFYYGMHIAVLAIFTKRLGLFYREGGVAASWLGWAALLVVMYPLCLWYARVKRRSRAWLIRMI